MKPKASVSCLIAAFASPYSSVGKMLGRPPTVPAMLTTSSRLVAACDLLSPTCSSLAPGTDNALGAAIPGSWGDELPGRKGDVEHAHAEKLLADPR
ncbi:hypothetical protein GCM10010307_49570 [Streptomyces vastus]|uniref:Uncharacterized protein n=1 Tax=Streptomyces vastus TaxID=285451 RepID=A0ABP6DGY6_9ACTN